MDTLDKKDEILEILNNLGYEKYKEKDYIKAIIYFERYLKLNPENPVINNMVGFLYQKLSKYENLATQINYFEIAVGLKPDYTCAIRNLALAYQLVGRYEDSAKCFHRLFELGPVDDDYMAYACLQIRLKNFDEGWKYYEWRFKKQYGPTEYPQIDKPRWEGQEIKDKTLLVQYEQGFGDSIQFCRYLETIKPLVGKIIFRVQTGLLPLMKINFKDIEVVGMNTPLDELSFDYHAPLMSLPYLTGATVHNIPLSKGYIEADKQKSEQYKTKYFDNNCLKIGISYNGMQLGNIRRNVPLKYFYPLAELENVKVYSFQKNFGSEQLQEVPDNLEIIDLGKTFNNFSDTAAALDNVDLFVTSDNGVFNLAAAMGKPTCLLLGKNAEWRWFEDDKKTPWYDSVKIFKKETELEDWSLAMGRVVDEIKKLL